jgi:DNA-binding HxlR family transcriptional regulator
MIFARAEADPRFMAALVRIGRHVETALVRSLCDGPRRFNEIVADLGDVGEDIIGSGLRELDTGGIVVRRVEPGPPLRVLYELTPLGIELGPALRAVADWAHRAEGA